MIPAVFSVVPVSVGNNQVNPCIDCALLIHEAVVRKSYSQTYYLSSHCVFQLVYETSEQRCLVTC